MRTKLQRDLHYDQGYMRASVHFSPIKYSDIFILNLIATCTDEVPLLHQRPHAFENQWGHIDALCDILIIRQEKRQERESYLF